MVIVVAAIDPCHSGPCHNGGVCSSSGSSYSCTCGAGWTGNNCENGE